MTEEQIVVAGEALIDLVAEPGGVYRPVPGGSPANVAVGLARLGARTQLLARLGSGAFGRLIREHLEDNRVGLDHAIDADEPATLAVVSLDAAGHATYDFYAEGTADWQWSPDELPDPLPAGTVALCTGSIAAARQPGSPAILQLLRRERERGTAAIVLDPNLRPALLGPPEDVREQWDTLIDLADVVKVSDEDLAWLVPGTGTAEIAKSWAERGPALVVVTRGGDGSVAATAGGTTVEIAAAPVDVVDTVGAGDSFTSGLVDSLRLRGLLGADARQRLAALGAEELRPILERSARIAAITCGRRGADPPTAAEVD
ncbi:carbohydrate kinase family protein [Phytoactinopolyspora halotolerans]|uniref:Carbohydrate kinase n=1 Tax=Phytoactinopolyspora halotolerans TaxID=1981512 RepID=A0A6L9SAR7_9ACTN|nr:carbohydrate kinase [Phytoactinopolyspora halotolerans]NEE01671.1 carbohydrate kinase [Phytoactinopolyspora halotolerans]